MAQFPVNPHRFDPYKTFKFRVRWDGRIIPGICQISELKRTTDVVTHREGGDLSTFRASPGLTTYDPIVLIRGRTHDNEFEDWVNQVWSLTSGSGSEVKLSDFRKDILIELHNEAGRLVMGFQVFRCWPSEYSPISTLDSGDSSVLHESIILQHEGWIRDQDIKEPIE